MTRKIVKKVKGKYGGYVVYLLCNVCGKEFRLPSYRMKEPNRGLFCSPRCSFKSGRIGNHNRGEKSHIWKGGRIKTSLGYILIYAPNHPHPNTPKGYVYEHRLVMEKVLGRCLKKDEFVHHLNHIPDDNRPGNLQMTNPHSHQRNHRLENLGPRDTITGRFVHK